MGNTPSQQPFESDPQEGTEPAHDASLPARISRSMRSFFAGVRRRLFGSPAHTASGDDSEAAAPPVAATQSRPAPPATTGGPEFRSIADIPARETPFTQPAEDGVEENESDLQATESGDRLAIYYPNCPGATIESDTWEHVER